MSLEELKRNVLNLRAQYSDLQIDIFRIVDGKIEEIQALSKDLAS